MAFSQSKYIADYRRKKYYEVSFYVQKGAREVLKKVAQSKGISLNQLISDALSDIYTIDLGVQNEQK